MRFLLRLLSASSTVGVATACTYSSLLPDLPPCGPSNFADVEHFRVELPQYSPLDGVGDISLQPEGPCNPGKCLKRGPGGQCIEATFQAQRAGHTACLLTIEFPDNPYPKRVARTTKFRACLQWEERCGYTSPTYYSIAPDSYVTYALERSVPRFSYPVYYNPNNLCEWELPDDWLAGTKSEGSQTEATPALLSTRGSYSSRRSRDGEGTEVRFLLPAPGVSLRQHFGAT